MPIASFKNHQPAIHPTNFIAPDSWLIGDVTLGKNVSVFFAAILRGDILPIRVGDNSNIQEHAMLHTSHGLTPCEVGKSVTVGHRAIIHGATVHDNCIVGMGSTILDGAIVESNCIVGANSLVTMGTVIPSGHLAIGSPAKAVRKLSAQEIDSLKLSAEKYVELCQYYREHLPRSN